MNPQNITLEELIKKDFLDQLTPEERVLLDKEKALYTEDEFDFIVVGVLQKIGDELPPGPLDDWEPDYEMIIRKGTAIRRRRRLKKWNEMAQIAALFLIMGGMVYYFFTAKEEKAEVYMLDGDCLAMADNDVIPVEESSCLLLLEDSTWFKVDGQMTGRIRQVGDLLISRTEEGAIKIERRVVLGTELPKIKDLVVYTGPQQQCVIEMEDGIRMRMNAQSYLTYSQQKRDSCYVGFAGEAYVETSADVDNKKTLVMATSRGKVIVTKADFVIRSSKDFTKTVLNTGELDLYSYNLNKVQSLYHPGDLGTLVALSTPQGQPVRDTLFRMEGMDFEIVQRWMNSIRVYDHMPLRAFVEEMSRWQGFTIKNWDCIPANKFISARVCYRSNSEEVYSAIRKAGVLLYEEKGMISFCPEDTGRKVALKEKKGGYHGRE